MDKHGHQSKILYSPPAKDTEVQMPGEDRPTVKKPAQWLLLYTLKVLEFYGILPRRRLRTGSIVSKGTL